MKVKVCGKNLDMKIDTGASWSILSEETHWNLVKCGCNLPLDGCDIQLLHRVSLCNNEYKGESQLDRFERNLE